jgi:hypothetical protein
VLHSIESRYIYESGDSQKLEKYASSVPVEKRSHLRHQHPKMASLRNRARSGLGSDTSIEWAIVEVS